MRPYQNKTTLCMGFFFCTLLGARLDTNQRVLWQNQQYRIWTGMGDD